MFNRFALLALPVFALALALVAGCQTNGTNQQADETFRGAQPVSLLEQTHGNDPSLEQPGVLLIRDQEALDRLGAESLQDLEVNFDENDLVVVALGQQPTGGYWAHITGVQRVGEVLYVQATVNRPGEDEAATQALTYPYAAAIVPKTDAAIALSDVEEVVGQPRPE